MKGSLSRTPHQPTPEKPPQTQNTPPSHNRKDGFKIQLSLRLAAANTAITAPSRIWRVE